MSRIAKKPIDIISGTSVDFEGSQLKVKGPKGSLELTLHESVSVEKEDTTLKVLPKVEDKISWAMAGTMRSLINNMIEGVNQGFEKKLKLIGVGYRAQVQGNKLNLILGFSHPIDFEIPEGIQIEAPSQTDLVIKGVDKQLVGEVSAKIRSFRPPEPYKGKGVRYADEHIKLKEAKKK